MASMTRTRLSRLYLGTLGWLKVHKSGPRHLQRVAAASEQNVEGSSIDTVDEDGFDEDVINEAIVEDIIEEKTLCEASIRDGLMEEWTR
jgi:hypothetical protein